MPEVTHGRRATRIARDHASTALRSVLAMLLLATAVVWPVPSADALTFPVTIAIDGVFADWNGVLTDGDNVQADPTGASDADTVAPGGDLSQVAMVWDTTYLYGYMRLNSQVRGRLEHRIFLDLNGDGLMGASDRVAVFVYNPHGKNTGAGLAPYTPANPAGDPLLGNGTSLPGTIGGVATVTGMASSDIVGGRAEMRIPWAGLGLAAGALVTMQFSTRDLGTGHVDNVNSLSTRYRGVALEPSNTQAAALGTTVEYTHTLTNTGNGSDTYALTRSSSLGWTVTVIDPDTGSAITNATVAAGATKSLVVRVTVPEGAAAGAKDVTTVRATSTANAGITAAVTNTTFAGPIGIDPNRSGSMAPGSTIQFTHTVSNDMPTAEVIDLTAISSNGWETAVFTAGGVPITSLSLASKASEGILVRLTVPADAALGTVDTMTVRAALQSEPSVFDEVTDTTTVRAALTVEPDQERITGVGSVLSYRHTITNSSPATRTFALSAVSSMGWTVTVLDTDGTTPIASASVPGNGGTKDVWVRVLVPASVPVGAVDETRLIATHMATGLSAFATNTTSVTQLVTYTSGALVTQSSSFGQEATVWAQGTALGPYEAVRFVWVDANGTTVRTSPPVEVEPDGTAVTSYALDRNAPVGTWTCRVVDATGGAEITRSTFAVTLVPWVTVTLSRGSVDFGTVTPGTPTASEQVALVADSNAPYTITRTVGGNVSEMGFTVSGACVGIKPAGANTWIDFYQALAPWTTDPDTPLTVTVTYTVVP